MGLIPRPAQKEAPEQWKNKVYGFGLLSGAVFGLLSSYMYARATEEDVSRVGKAQRISTGELLGLGLAVLAVIRQITELGKGPDRPKKK